MYTAAELRLHDVGAGELALADGRIRVPVAQPEVELTVRRGLAPSTRGVKRPELIKRQKWRGRALRGRSTREKPNRGADLEECADVSG